MAELIVDGDELVVRLRAVEKLEGVHGEVRVPLISVTSVEVLDDAAGAVHGFRVQQSAGKPSKRTDRSLPLISRA